MESLVRKACRPDEIHSVLLGALAQEKVFTVWQRNRDKSLIFNIKARLESIDERGNFEFALLHQPPEKAGGEVFFAIEDSSLLFKTANVQIKGAKIVVVPPQEATYRERRRHKRKRFKYKDHKDAEMVFDDVFNPDDGGPLTIKSKVLDLSEGGACLLVSKETLAKINTGNSFRIRSLSDLDFSSGRAKIMNARRYRGRKLNQEELYAIGVMFC